MAGNMADGFLSLTGLTNSVTFPKLYSNFNIQIVSIY